MVRHPGGVVYIRCITGNLGSSALRASDRRARKKAPLSGCMRSALSDLSDSSDLSDKIAHLA